MTTCIVTPEIIQLLLQPFQENPKKSIIVLRYGELEQLDHQSKFYDDHDHFSLRVSSHIDCMFCSKHLHAKQKKSAQGFQQKINEGGTLQPNQWHFQELRHLPNHHVSVAEWTPTHARTSALKKTPDTMTSWSVDDWTAAVAASTENRSQVTKIPNPVPKHKRSTAMWRLKISWTHTGLNTVPPAPRKLQSKWPIFCSTRLFQNAVIAGLQGERKALWSATHIQHHKNQSLASPSSKAVSLQLRFIRAARSTYTSKFFFEICAKTKTLEFEPRKILGIASQVGSFPFQIRAASTNLAVEPALREVAPRPIPWTRWPKLQEVFFKPQKKPALGYKLKRIMIAICVYIHVYIIWCVYNVDV